MKTPSIFRLFASRKVLAGILTFLFVFIAAGEAFSLDLVPKRRKKQWSNESGYMFLPMPYSLPGVGSGMMLSTLSANTLGTNTDVFFVAMTGAASGFLLGVEDIHLLKETVTLELNSFHFSKVAFNSYGLRGMDTTADQYNIMSISDISFNHAIINYTAWEKRLKLFYKEEQFKLTLNEIKDPQGNVIATFTTPPKQNTASTTYGFNLDLTDDNVDPRRGFRVDGTRKYTPPETSDSPDFYIINLAITGYIPVGKISTIGIRYEQSDAHVTTPGLIDPVALHAKNDLNCLGDPTCQAIEDALVQNELNANLNGTASSLGGDRFLRGYPMDRFSSAHMRYVGAEFRWNLSEGSVPFNYWIWKDVRTSNQLAFFYETGTVAEYAGDLWKQSRSNIGVGFRLVAASGYSYRVDVAKGDEGVNPTIIFGFPW